MTASPSVRQALPEVPTHVPRKTTLASIRGLGAGRSDLLATLEDRPSTQATTVTCQMFAPHLQSAIGDPPPPDATLSVHFGIGHTAWTPGAISGSGYMIFNFNF